MNFGEIFDYWRAGKIFSCQHQDLNLSYRTCKNFENRPTVVFCGQNFALAREIIHDHEFHLIQYF